MIPIRLLFRNRWAALLWAAGICWTAVSFAGGEGGPLVDAANASDNAAAVNGALAAEDD